MEIYFVQELAALVAPQFWKYGEREVERKKYLFNKSVVCEGGGEEGMWVIALTFCYLMVHWFKLTIEWVGERDEREKKHESTHTRNCDAFEKLF